MATHTPSRTSPGADRTLDVLEALVKSDEMTLTALAATTRIPLATCAAIAYTLEARGYAVRRIVGRSHFWSPTLRLYGLGTELIRKLDLAAVALPPMQAFAEVIDLPVHLGVLEGAQVVYVAKAATPGFVQFNTYPGKVAPFNLTALGRAIAAFLPDPDIRPLLDRLEAGRGPRGTAPSAEAFLDLLGTVRTQGFATEFEEEQADIACLAAPVFGADGHILAAVGVTGFSKDLHGKALTAATDGVTSLARDLTHRFGGRGRSSQSQ